MEFLVKYRNLQSCFCMFYINIPIHHSKWLKCLNSWTHFYEQFTWLYIFTVTSSHDADRLGWSADADRNLTSSVDFNKLQQTNVHNYESLLLSDTNSKSPTKRSTSARKSTDLNQMIQHSLTQLSQVI